MKALLLYSLVPLPNSSSAHAHTTSIISTMSRVMNDFAARAGQGFSVAAADLAGCGSMKGGIAGGILDNHPQAQVVILIGTKELRPLASIAKTGRPVMVVTDEQSAADGATVCPAYLEVGPHADFAAEAEALLMGFSKATTAFVNGSMA